MKTHFSLVVSRFSLVLGLAWLSALACAGQSQFVNAKLETRAANPDLQKVVAQITAEAQQSLWIAYAVESVSPNGNTCCN